MKKSRLLSALLAIVMLATVFTVACISATAVTVPYGYELVEENFITSFVNGTNTGGVATYNRQTVTEDFPGSKTAPMFYGTFSRDTDITKKEDIFRYFSTNGDGMNGFPEDKTGLAISFWIRYKPVSTELDNIEKSVEFGFYERDGGKSSNTYFQTTFNVVGNDTWQEVIVPITELDNAEAFNGEGIHTFYLKSSYTDFAKDDYIAVADFHVVKQSYQLKKVEGDNQISDNANVGDIHTSTIPTQDMRFQFKESIYNSSSNTYTGGDVMYSDFEVSGNSEWQHIVFPVSDMNNSNNFDGDGAWTVTYSTKKGNTFITGDIIEFADLKIMKSSAEEGVADTVVLENFMNLPGNTAANRMVDFAKTTVTDIPDIESAVCWEATLREDYDGLVYNNSNALWNNTTHQKDFTYSSSKRKDGLTGDKTGLYFSFWVRYTPKNATTYEAVENNEYTGAKITITAGNRFNAQDTSYGYEFATPLDATDVYEKATLNLKLRLTGTVATKAAEVYVRLDSKTYDGETVSVYAPIELAASTDWQTFKIPFENFASTFAASEFAKDNIVGIAIESVNASGTVLTVATNDTIEIADVKISKTATAPVNASAIDLKISKVSLTLQDNLTMNFKVAKSLFVEKYANPYVMVGDRKLDGVVNGDYYVFSYDGISPQNIRKTISATVYATYGGAVIEGKTLEYSVKKYCDTLLANGTADEQTRTLIVDLLNYGAAAQEYTGVRVNNLANRDLSEEQAGWGTAETPIVKDHSEKRGEEGTVAWESAGLALDDSVIVNLQFGAQSKENLKVVITDGTNTLATYEGEEIKAVDADSFLVSFDGLNAKNMRRLIYATVYDGDTAVSNELVYSVESYVRQVADLAAAGDTSVDAKLVNLVDAMIKYGDAAIVYAVR